ncbi:MAG TPA: hypothetical protein DDW65_03705 [Firmicutes bacterium]|jgi:hypothetical protein|nr:hypothetical protein [Bacillota bacterium]
MMKRSIKWVCLLTVGVVLFSAICLGSDSPMSQSKAYEDLSKDKGKDCYIIGKFAMTHLEDRAVADEKIASEGRDINSECSFSTRIELVNTDTNKTFLLNLKPVNGSATAYYHNEKMLTENSNDPYWILKVPAGTYEIRNFISSLILRMPGYQDFRAAVIETPVNRVAKKTIHFTAQEKQLIYIGDYDTTLTTYICLNAMTSIYTFRNLKIDLKDNFETLKTDFIDGANDKLKEKLNDYEFVSILN